MVEFCFRFVFFDLEFSVRFYVYLLVDVVVSFMFNMLCGLKVRVFYIIV